jgi:predicted methyltransferase
MTNDPRKDLETFNAVRNNMTQIISEVSIRLFETYRRSDEYKEHEKTGTVLTLNQIRSLAKNRTFNDLLVAQICLVQEGTVPPKNAFHTQDDLVRKTIAMAGDKDVLEQIESGYAQVCVHSSLEALGGDLSEWLTEVSNRLSGVRTPDDGGAKG